MSKMTFIIGGARSGKSSYAISIAKNIKGKVVYLAPGVAVDDEMRIRIETHKKMRPKSWQTIEEPINVELALKMCCQELTPDSTADSSIKCIIFDCLSFWVSNLILHLSEVKPTLIPLLEENIIDRIAQFLELAKIWCQGVTPDTTKKMIIVSNEVGMGVVPDTQLGRIFRDILGKANQLVKDSADEVLFMIAGVPIKIK